VREAAIELNEAYRNRFLLFIHLKILGLEEQPSKFPSDSGFFVTIGFPCNALTSAHPLILVKKR
jgi:hypothetical protein